MATAIRLGVLAGAFALITVAVAWWAIVPVAALWGSMAGPDVRRANLISGLAAGAGWLALLAVAAPLAETLALAEAFSRLLSMPGPLMLVATSGLGVLLGFLGSWLGCGLRSRRTG